MTRGKIIYIDKDGNVYSSVEFNGDMYPDGNADEILYKFEAGYFATYNRYENFVEHFNKKHYGYPEELIRAVNCEEKRTINVTKNYTDYLYIINNSECEWVIKDGNGITFLDKRSLAIVRFQQVENINHRAVHKTVGPIDYTLSKEEFEDILDRLRETTDLVAKVNDLYRYSRENQGWGFDNVGSLQISHESIVVMLLKKMMRDSYDNIDYFIYELDYGRKYETGMIRNENDQDMDFSSAGKLYDYLTGQKS